MRALGPVALSCSIAVALLPALAGPADAQQDPAGTKYFGATSQKQGVDLTVFPDRVRAQIFYVVRCRGGVKLRMYILTGTRSARFPVLVGGSFSYIETGSYLPQEYHRQKRFRFRAEIHGAIYGNELRGTTHVEARPRGATRYTCRTGAVTWSASLPAST